MSTTDKNTSILISGQLPGFIADEYPRFVAFLEAYYEFLEQTNGVTNSAKNVLNFHDADYLVNQGLNEFMEYMRRQYLSILPTSLVADKAKVLKNIKQFYSSRGSEKSYKFLFRALFNEDVVLHNLSDDILRLSDGKWYQKTVLRISTSNVIQEFVGTQIVGANSSATAVVESATQILANNVLFTELEVSNIQRVFTVNEIISTQNNITSNTLYATIIGAVETITVTSPGLFYNVGDPVVITGGGGTGATAVVSAVTTGSVTSIGVVYGGTGYKGNVDASHAASIAGGGGTGATGQVFINSDGQVHANTFILNDDLLSLANNISLSGTYTNFLYSNINANSVMANSFSYTTFSNLGPVASAVVLSKGTGFLTIPTITVEPNPTSGNSNTSISNYGIVGEISINNGGNGYMINDEVVITANNILGCFGAAAAGLVANVAANGSITKITMVEPRIAGSANVSSGSNVVIGLSTAFTTELVANNNANTLGSGTLITIAGQTKKVMDITNNNVLIVNSNFSTTNTNQRIALTGMFPGGFGFTQNDCPLGATITVQSANTNAVGANLQLKSILGFGAILLAGTSGSDSIGAVQQISVTSIGQNYISNPSVNLTGSGDGLARATARIITGTYKYPGRWLNEDGRLSSRKYIQDVGKYNQFSYLVTSKISLDKYEQFLRDVVHPLGTNMVAVMEIDVEPEFYSANINSSGTSITLS